MDANLFLALALLAGLAGLVGIAVVAVRLDPLMARVEEFLTLVSTGFILFAMGFVCLEVAMRYLFNSPIPGHLEISEMFVPVIVFLAVAYTQSHGGHVGMTLVVENLSPRVRRYADIATLGVSAITYGILAYFSAKHAYRGWLFDDVTPTPPYFPTWPFSSIVPLGMGLCALRLYLQMLREVAPGRFPSSGKDSEEFPVVE